jgi:hypothetical protein
MSGTRQRTARTTRRAVALAVGALVAVLLPGVTATAAPSATATAIRFDRISTPGVSLPSTPGANGLWYVVRGQTFQADLSFVDRNVLTPLSANQTTTVTVSYKGVALGSVDVPAGGKTATVALAAIGDAVTDVSLTASADTKPRATTGTSRPFDVLIESNPVAPNARTVIGGQNGTATECNATADATVCADLVPPAAGFTAGGLFSRGICSTTDSCKDTYIQALAALPANPLDPATLIMKCDKDRCGVGAIKKQTLLVTLSPDPSSALGGDVTAPACASKGVVTYDATKPYSSRNAPFCVDYVQSTRDNAGDTILYLLFILDAKVRFP